MIERSEIDRDVNECESREPSKSNERKNRPKAIEEAAPNAPPAGRHARAPSSAHLLAASDLLR
ncbi:hypothetical protein GBA52_010968 [Prunus armeniaca]|nr:hypothetical protein GBA52_010968 [Prunus armeniaca]